MVFGPDRSDGLGIGLDSAATTIASARSGASTRGDSAARAAVSLLTATARSIESPQGVRLGGAGGELSRS